PDHRGRKRNKSRGEGRRQGQSAVERGSEESVVAPVTRVASHSCTMMQQSRHAAVLQTAVPPGRLGPGSPLIVCFAPPTRRRRGFMRVQTAAVLFAVLMTASAA